MNIEKDNKIKDLVNTSLEKIRSMVDVNCVIGETVSLPDNSALIPITKVTVDFLAGGGEYSDLNAKRNSADFPMAGGTGGGYTVNPIGFFVLKDNKFKLIHADKSSAYMTLLKSVTEIMKKMANKDN